MNRKKISLIFGFLIVFGLVINAKDSNGITREVYTYTYGVDDSYVYSDKPNSNYGLIPLLWVENISGIQCESYMQFDISNRTSNWITAEVSLTLFRASEDTDITLCLINESWEEWGITWYNKPKHENIISTFSISKDQHTTQKYVYIDVSNYIQGNNLSLCLYADNGGNVTFYSSNAIDIPSLLYVPKITWTSLEEAEINVIAPISSDIPKMGGQLSINWTSIGSIEDVQIELYEGSNSKDVIDYLTENDGFYIWELPERGYLESDDYRIKITDAGDNNVFGFSEYFSITEHGDEGIDITIPIEVTYIILIMVLSIISLGYSLLSKLKKFHN